MSKKKEHDIKDDAFDPELVEQRIKNIDIEKATLPFYKSSKDIATEHLGLGLNISKILSERHGGNIQIANNKAGGACVTVKINCNES